MKFIDGLPPYALALAACICFAMALWFFWHESLKTAGALSALFFLCVVLAYIPKAESISAFAVNVRLKQNVELAKDAIEQLRDLAKVNARVAYTTLGWGNRMGAPSAAEKKAVLDLVEKQLEALHVSKAERKEIARPVVRLLGLDLYTTFLQTMDRYVHVREQDFAKMMRERAEDQATKDAYQKHIFAVNDWRLQLDHPYDDVDGYNFRAALRRATPTTWVSQEDAEAARKLADQVQALFDACVTEGGYTTEAAAFIDRYGSMKGYDDKLKETFGRALN
ncbi:hypothetical protein [Bradyrhizobium japonicum]|uniref:hypothetical protein n=1 Tax=Bradyrhizobium japonicum TaxID=375 RepID=UPI000456DB1F|nr:hypothetical protein [Bradyrhizobium japonicum]AHY55101.1 hypothetical protein BJS_04621 [Bradyrhizobium japonicum SEMIA 5079]MCD9110631.1 hypothetical protein [Bradyrhizobium japonicum]MCD9258854.1 hypothetical protein [Bradyrhizobium japonicum SEMIA 5079]MCD9823041.1 hypothetical protein [Bradyrhizobium japonicum]MCD9895295.1 hypothetical protein [Bradyrhizobium japonicum]